MYPLKRTVYFGILHFIIATSVLYVLTGDFLLGSMIALIEPSVNTVAFYFHERAWAKKMSAFKYGNTVKTLSFATVHFSVAFSVVYLLTGDWVASSLAALIEPALNTVAYSILSYFVFSKDNTVTSNKALHCA